MRAQIGQSEWGGDELLLVVLGGWWCHILPGITAGAVRTWQALLLALMLGEVALTVHLHLPCGETGGPVISLLQLN